MGAGIERTPTSELVFCVVGGVLVATTAVGFLRKVQLRRLFSTIRSRLPEWRGQEEDDELGPLVRAKMQQLALDHVRKACQACCLIMAVWIAMMISNIVRGTAIRSYWVQDVPQLLGLGVLNVVLLCPGALSAGSMDRVYVCLAACSTAFVSPWLCSPEMLIDHILIVDQLVVCFNMARRSLRVIVPMNLIHAFVTSATILSQRELPFIKVGYYLSTHLMTLTAFPLIAYSLEVSMAATIRQTLSVQASKELFLAASALLRSCCDVVVEVNGEGIITCPALDLGSFLLRDPCLSLQNTRLVDFLPDEDDKRLFEKLLGQRPKGVGLAEANQVVIRDANNVQLKVEILSFQFRHLDGQPRYMIGLRDLADASEMKHGQPARQRREASSPTKRSDENRSGDNRFDESLPDDSPPDDSPTYATEGSSDDELENSRSCVDTTEHDVSEAMVVVDFTTDRVRVRGCSALFQMRVGRLATGSSLLDVVQREDEFMGWLNMAVQYGSDWPSCHVTLDLRQGRVKASCRVDEETDDSHAVDRKRVQLRFYKIKRCSSHSDGCQKYRPHTNFRGTPPLHVTL